MKISMCYPPNAKKLYHISPGQVIQFNHNDGTVDNDFYMVTTVGTDKTRDVINLNTGAKFTTSVSCRCTVFKEAMLVPSGYGE